MQNRAGTLFPIVYYAYDVTATFINQDCILDDDIRWRIQHYLV